MRKQSIFGFLTLKEACRKPAFVFYVGVLLCGIIAGSISAIYGIGREGTWVQELGQYYIQNIDVQLSYAGKTTWLYLLQNAGVIGAIYVFGGLLASPYLVGLIVAAKGCVMSFGVTALVLCAGKSGIWLSLFAIALPGILLLPALVLTASIAAEAYSAAAGRKKTIVLYITELKKAKAPALTGLLLLFFSFALKYGGLCIVKILPL